MLLYDATSQAEASLDGDLVTYFAAGLIGLFAVLSWVLLSKYRILTVKVAESTELGRDIWNALDSRLKKQDERILDVVTRFDVYESRLAEVTLPRAAKERIPVQTAKAEVQPQQKAEAKEEQKQEVKTAAPTREDLEPTERVVLQLLMERPRTSIEIKTLVKKSREHSARLMKTLFERRLVSRADQKKPFVYELTEEGRRYLSAS